MTAPTSAAKKPRTGTPMPDEAVIDAPSRQTMFMLGVVSLTTLLMWGAGRAACNYFVPNESKTPRALTVEEKSRTAKDAAMEFTRAVAGADFDVAAKLAKDAAVPFVAGEKAKCSDCEARRASAAKLLMVPVVLQDNGKEAYVKVEVQRSPWKRPLLLHLARVGMSWVVTESLPEGAKIPQLAAAEVPFQMTPGGPPALLRRPPESGTVGPALPGSAVPPSPHAAAAPGASAAPAASPAAPAAKPAPVSAPLPAASEKK